MEERLAEIVQHRLLELIPSSVLLAQLTTSTFRLPAFCCEYICPIHVIIISVATNLDPDASVDNQN